MIDNWLYADRKDWRERYNFTGERERYRHVTIWRPMSFGTYWWINVQDGAREDDVGIRLGRTGSLLYLRKRWGVDSRSARDTAIYWSMKCPTGDT